MRLYSLAPAWFFALSVLLTAAGCSNGPVECLSGGCTCASDSDCPPASPRCNPAKAACVPCLPANDNCAMGTHCVSRGDTFECVKTCHADSDCTGMGRLKPTCCNETCVDANSDITNCGQCGAVCETPAHGMPGCEAAACVLGSCDPGYADCNKKLDDGCEKHTDTDVTSCGACGTECPTGPLGTATCTVGKCGLACNAGYGDCNLVGSDGCEVDLGKDAKNCGACRNACPQPPSATVSCHSGTCAVDKCNPGLADCDQKTDNGCEADTTRDPAHCGGCGVPCNPPHATPSCVMGACKIGGCLPGWSDCDGNPANGCESSTGDDVNNCGACGNKCAAQNSVPSCIRGACVILACTPGFGDCDQRADNGCEVNIGQDALNCGSCGKGCPGYPNASRDCVAGRCTLVKCFTGYGDCNRDVNDGCEASFSSPQTCGGCGGLCPTPNNAQASCMGGVCGLGQCNAQWANCDGKPGNGCETSLQTDPSNCGFCGRACFAPNGNPGCVGGNCTVASCSPGYKDCNNIPGDGCETAVGNDRLNCGACQLGCPTPQNAQAICFNGSCSGLCAFGFGDCDKNMGNGCEASLLSDVKNCGVCGVSCPNVANGTPGCSTGSCGVSKCNAGFADCDGKSINGCEVATAADVNNCGACGLVCSAKNANSNCVNGLCGIASCVAGHSDCNGLPGDGCEVQTGSDPSNCGQCGNVCPTPQHASATCVSSLCGGACSFGFSDCNSSMGDGCETDIANDANNCSGCGRVCPGVANGTPGCKVGACAVARSCIALWGDCDGSPGNGCERSLAADVSNCGACGKVCSVVNASPACVGGQCGVGQCNAGWGNCDNNAGNGCETNVNSDANNCGVCGNKCGVNTPYCILGVCSAPTHNTQQLTWDFVAAPGCGDASTWYTQNFGSMTWDQCEAQANKYGAMYAGAPNLNYAAPYVGITRWAGERDATTAWLTTGSWNSLSIVNKASAQNCVLGYANGQTHGNMSINQTLTSQTNGITYYAIDLGVTAENTCYSAARNYGARTLNPASFGINNGLAHMIENHSNHGSCLYSGVNYNTDGNCNHNYRCVIGYYP